jgi:Zn-finger nucleic acid-binding protein
MSAGDEIIRCPACFNQLTVTQVGSVTVDVCQDGCGGVWFDAFELEKVDQEEEAAGESLLHIRHDPMLAVDSVRKRECPRCSGIKLHRHFFSAKRKVQVDHCPNCGGYWLDAGELAQIRAERSKADSEEGGQKSSISAEVIRYLYKLTEGTRGT